MTGTEKETPDPREAMREALERKKNQHHDAAASGPNKQNVSGGPHGQASGKRVFRRKSGS